MGRNFIEKITGTGGKHHKSLGKATGITQFGKATGFNKSPVEPFVKIGKAIKKHPEKLINAGKVLETVGGILIAVAPATGPAAPFLAAGGVGLEVAGAGAVAGGSALKKHKKGDKKGAVIEIAKGAAGIAGKVGGDKISSGSKFFEKGLNKLEKHLEKDIQRIETEDQAVIATQADTINEQADRLDEANNPPKSKLNFLQDIERLEGNTQRIVSFLSRNKGALNSMSVADRNEILDLTLTIGGLL